MVNSMTLPPPPVGGCSWCGKEVLFVPRENWQTVAASMTSAGLAVNPRVVYQVVGHAECEERLAAKYEQEEKQEHEKAIRAARAEVVTKWYLNPLLPVDVETKTFDSFNLEQGSIKAFQALSHWRSGDDFGFIVSGPAGTGKSHLCFALLNRVISEAVNAPVDPTERPGVVPRLNLPVYWSVSELLAKMRSNQGSTEFPTGVMTSKLLFLDDLGTENLTDWSRDLLFRLFDYRLNHRLPALVTTNLKLNELKDRMHERVTSRVLALCIPLSIEGKDRRRDVLSDRARILGQRIKGEA